jgi:hypothetical protein
MDAVGKLALSSVTEILVVGDEQPLLVIDNVMFPEALTVMD